MEMMSSEEKAMNATALHRCHAFVAKRPVLENCCDATSYLDFLLTPSFLSCMMSSWFVAGPRMLKPTHPSATAGGSAGRKSSGPPALFARGVGVVRIAPANEGLATLAAAN